MTFYICARLSGHHPDEDVEPSHYSERSLKPFRQQHSPSAMTKVLACAITGRCAGPQICGSRCMRLVFFWVRLLLFLAFRQMAHVSGFFFITESHSTVLKSYSTGNNMEKLFTSTWSIFKFTLYSLCSRSKFLIPGPSH